MTDEPYADPALRAALGSLLLDEPSAPPIVDDVARGRARQRRRRARVGAGLGLAAALVLGVALIGPLRPGTVTVLPGGSAPSVPGVSPEWFAGITPALLDRITGVVDWDQSTVQGSASTGFLADLTIVPVAVTMNGENRTVELLPGNGRTGRMTLQWMPGRTGPGPALARCPVAACPEQGPTGFVGGQIDMGATAGPDAGFPEGTVIIDRQYPQGLLELVNYPSAPPATLPPSVRDWAYIPGVIATEFLTDLGNPVAAPAPAPSSTSEVPVVPGVSRQWLEGISPALGAQVGWVVDWPDSTVYGDVARGLQLDLTIVPGTQVQRDPLRFAVPSPPYPERASLRIWFAPNGQAPGAALAECPPDRCSRDLPDRKFPTYLDQAATAGTGTSLAPGTLVVDRTYDSGRFVELVSVPVESGSASPSGQAPQSVLSYGLAGAFLDALRAPEAAPAGGAASP